MFVHVSWPRISQPVLRSVFTGEGNYLPCCHYRALLTLPEPPRPSHEVCVSVCVCMYKPVWFLNSSEWEGWLCYLQCHLIDLILVLLAFISLCVWSTPTPSTPSPVPTATRGYWLHNSGACSVFVHVYAYVSVTALGSGNQTWNMQPSDLHGLEAHVVHYW